MSNLVIVSCSVKRGKIEATTAILQEITDLMSEFDGCLSVQLVQDVINNEKFKLYEKWESEEKHKKFVDQLKDNGLFSQLLNNLDDKPSSETYKTND